MSLSDYRIVLIHLILLSGKRLEHIENTGEFLKVFIELKQTYEHKTNSDEIHYLAKKWHKIIVWAKNGKNESENTSEDTWKWKWE